MISVKGASAIVVSMLACAPQPALAQRIRFHVPRQLAVTGIPEFARQANVQIVSPAGIANLKTGAVDGVFSVDDGLRMLLKGTGLYVSMRNGRIISLAISRPTDGLRTLPRPRRAIGISKSRTASNDDIAPTPPPDIIVSGTRLRLSPSPQEEKRSSIAFVSSVGSEELARRTDTSVVAALERLPGIVRQRGTQTSQAWYPAIRGIPGWYNSVTLDDGMLYLSTRNQRGVPLDFIPADIINEIVVNKTVTPEMDPNSIGGHIDIRTLRAFDNDGASLTKFNGQTVNYAQPGALRNANPSYNLSGVIKRTLGAANDFGFVLAGATHKDQYNEIQNTTTTLIQRYGMDIPSGNITAGNYNSRAHGFSVMGKLEGRGDGWYGYVAGNYFREDIIRDLSRSNLSIVPADVTNATPDNGDFSAATPSALSHLYGNDRRVFSVRGGLEYRTNDTSKIVFNASYLKARFDERSWIGASFIGPSVSGSYAIDDRSASSTIASVPALGDPARWIQDSASAKQIFYPLKTEIVTARLEYKANDFEFSRGGGYDFGIDFRQMWRRLDQYQINYQLRTGTTIDLGQVLADDSTFDGTDPGRAIYVDADKYWNLMGTLGLRTVAVPQPSNYQLSEAVIAPFAALYYTTDRFRIIAGARYNITHYTNATHTVTNSVVTPFRITRTLPYLLPNIQGYFNIRNNLRLRAAYTETTALQNYSDYLTGVTTNYDGKGMLYIQGANPYLKPRKSYNEDLGLEWYLRRGYISLGYFHKTITNESQSITQYTYDANGVLTSFSQTPVNGGGEHTQGVEFEGAWRDFSGIAPWLRGLSVDANAAWFKSDTETKVGTGIDRRIRAFKQQPKWVANLILNYDRGPFSASLIGQARGRALATIASSPENDIYISSYKTLDARLSYKINRFSKVYFEGRNLTNYWYKEVYGILQDKVSTAIRSGPIYLIGVSLSL